MSTKISVLVSDDEANRFEAFCTERGHKKSTLIARLIKDHLDREQYQLQRSLLIGGAASQPHDLSSAKRL
ncbi:MAG TPA: hypothetical protein VK629_14020 [Steroidobacteraceae bacterium]|nr:hypothetical protein [Steroidobacteraceae bacterium]